MRSRTRHRVVATLQERGTHQGWVLAAGLAGMFANNFPFTVLVVSLGVIADDLGSSETTLAWVVTAPILLSAVALPVLGKLGDLYGHRLVFLLGSAAGAIIGVATALAWDAGSLIGARTISAILGAATGPSSMALIFTAYGPRERNRAMGWWSMMGAGAPALGLIAGGPLVEWLGWRVLFLVQGAFAFLALAFAWFVLAETERQRVRFDLKGSIALAVGAGGWMYVVGLARDVGFSHPSIVAAAVVGTLALIAFVRIERRTPEPLLPLEFFARRNFTFPILSNTLQSAAYMGAFVLAAFVLQEVLGFSIAYAAPFMLLRTATLTIAAPLGGLLGERLGERFASVLGTALVTISMALLAWGAQSVSVLWFGAGLVLQGAGQGLCSPSLNAAVSSAVPAKDLGIATAANRLINQVGTAFGISLLTAVYGGQSEAFGIAFALGALLAGASVVMAVFIRPFADQATS